jgi:hypothetical protein
MALFIIDKENKNSFLVNEDELREVIQNFSNDFGNIIKKNINEELIAEYNIILPHISLSPIEFDELIDKAINSIFKKIEIL